MPEKWNIFERCIFQICLTKAVVQSCFEMFCVHSSNFLEHGYIIQHPCSIFNDFLDPHSQAKIVLWEMPLSLWQLVNRPICQEVSNQFFSKSASDFSEICMKSEGLKCQNWQIRIFQKNSHFGEYDVFLFVLYIIIYFMILQKPHVWEKSGSSVMPWIV